MRPKKPSQPSHSSAAKKPKVDDDLYRGYDLHRVDSDSEINLDAEQLRREINAVNVGRQTRRPSSKVFSTASGHVGDDLTRSGSTRTTHGATGDRDSRAVEKRPTTFVHPAARLSTRNHAKSTVTISKRPTFDGSSPSMVTPPAPKRPTQKYRDIEKDINDDLDQSCFAYEKGDLKMALDKAKGSVRKHHDYAKQKAADSVNPQNVFFDDFGAPSNAETLYSVMFNLGTQYMNSAMPTEALKIYETIVKNKSFNNIGYLHVNIGNIHFQQGDYYKAIRHYQMCLDQVPEEHARVKSKILNNIATCFIKMNLFLKALLTFEQIMQIQPTVRTGFSILLCYKLLGQKKRLKSAFQDMLAVNTKIDDEEKHVAELQNDRQYGCILEAIRNDGLRQMEKSRKSKAEGCIMMAAKILIGDGNLKCDEYDWVIEQIKTSHFHELSQKMEVEKVIRCLKNKKFEEATETLTVVERTMSGARISSSVASNLALMCHHLLPSDETQKYSETALAMDRYNSAAIVNQGNILFERGDFQSSRNLYHEAVRLNASCPEALFNFGLSEKRLGRYTEALACFNKLLAILKKDPQVIFQIADLHDLSGDKTKAIEWFVQLLGAVPSDVGVLCRLARLHESLNDKNHAFPYYMDAFRYDQNNTTVLEWLGVYFIESQSVDQALEFLQKGALVQPTNIHWQLMIASCHRRGGNYRQAVDIYKNIHRRFPNNLECLQLLVRLSTDLSLPEAPQLVDKLSRIERRARQEKEKMSGEPVGIRQQETLTGNEATATKAFGDDSEEVYLDPLKLDPAADRHLRTSCRQNCHEDFANVAIDDLLPR